MPYCFSIAACKIYNSTSDRTSSFLCKPRKEIRNQFIRPGNDVQMPGGLPLNEYSRLASVCKNSTQQSWMTFKVRRMSFTGTVKPTQAWQKRKNDDALSPNVTQTYFPDLIILNRSLQLQQQLYETTYSEQLLLNVLCCLHYETWCRQHKGSIMRKR